MEDSCEKRSPKGENRLPSRQKGGKRLKRHIKEQKKNFGKCFRALSNNNSVSMCKIKSNINFFLNEFKVTEPEKGSGSDNPSSILSKTKEFDKMIKI